MKIEDDIGTNTTEWSAQDATLQATLQRGTALGRYVIIEPIGSGGMGSIYRAYDPELNRGVALKILSVKQENPQAAQRAKTRLIREAQALARLSHPNVVAVHDVGSFGDDVFIAMELIEGQTLKEWLDEENKPIKEILAVMTAAGRGLAAAHQAGLIHRDFKPTNVIIGDDGRVRVLDFGLARAVTVEDAATPFSAATTDSGGLSFEETKKNKQDKTKSAQGANEEAGQDARLDSQDSSQPSKKILDRVDVTSTKSNLLLSTLTCAGGILGTPLYMAPEQHLGMKTDERTDQFGFCVVLYEALYGRRPFGATTLRSLKKAVLREQISSPPEDTPVPSWLWQIIRKGLSAEPQDRYPSLSVLLEDLDKDPDEVRHQRRQARRRVLLVILLILLTITAPIGVWFGLRYRTVQLCKDVEGELAGVWDETTKTTIKTSFLNTKTSFALGTWERVDRTLERYLTNWVQMRGDVCEARLLRATQSEDLFDLRMGCLRKRIAELKALVEVFAKADASVVQKAVQASASLPSVAICADEHALQAPYPPPNNAQAKAKVESIHKQLTRVEALHMAGKYKEGLELIQRLEMEADAVAYRPVQAEVLYQNGNLFDSIGEYKQAEKIMQKAARTAGKIQASLLVAKAMIANVWLVGYRQARPQEGLLIAQDAQIMLDVAGGDDRLQIMLLKYLGGLFYGKGDYIQALDYFQKTLSSSEKVLGLQHPERARTLNNMGAAYYNLGKYDKALQCYRETLVIQENALGPEHPELAQTLNNIGNVFNGKGDHNKALEFYNKSLSIREKTLGPEHPDVAQALNNIGESLWMQGSYQKALIYLRKALVIKEKTLGLQHPLLASTLSGIGNVLIDSGMPQEALEPLARVVRLCDAKPCQTVAHGSALLGLSRSMVATGGDKAYARRLALQARDLFQHKPKVFSKELAHVKAWLKELQPSG